MCRKAVISFILGISLIFLSNCAEKKFRDAHDENILESSNFAEVKDEVADLSQDLPDMVFECKKASFNLENVGLNTLANLLGKVYGQNMNSTVGPENREVFVNIRVKDICLEPLLDELTNLYNIGYEKTYSAYTLYPPEVRSKIFTLDYHNFYRDGASSISISSTQLEESGTSNNRNNNYSKIDTKSKESFWDNLEKTLSTIVLDGVDNTAKLSPGADGTGVLLKGHVAVYRDSGVIVVRSYPRTLKHVEAFLSSITHKATKQVLIEAKILEVTLSDEYKSGIYWDMLKKKFKFSSFYDGSVIGGGVDKLYNNQQMSSSDQGMASSVISAKLNYGSDFHSVIQALSIQGKVSVLSSPKIAALNNQRALIKFGDDSYFITNVTTTTLSNSSAQGSASQQGFSMTPYFSGIALDTTPSIMNNNEIILHIHPMISTVVPETKEITISGLSSKVPAAKVQTRETDTVVKAHSGDIIVIGGLMQSTVGQTESGLPSPGGVISKIFSTIAAKQKTSRKIELVILLRPTISPGWTHSDEEFAKYLSNPPKPRVEIKY